VNTVPLSFFLLLIYFSHSRGYLFNLPLHFVQHLLSFFCYCRPKLRFGRASLLTTGTVTPTSSPRSCSPPYQTITKPWIPSPYPCTAPGTRSLTYNPAESHAMSARPARPDTAKSSFYRSLNLLLTHLLESPILTLHRHQIFFIPIITYHLSRHEPTSTHGQYCAISMQRSLPSPSREACTSYSLHVWLSYTKASARPTLGDTTTEGLLKTARAHVHTPLHTIPGYSPPASCDCMRAICSPHLLASSVMLFLPFISRTFAKSILPGVRARRPASSLS